MGIFNSFLLKQQAGWIEHDLGHSSVFKSTKLNRFFQATVMTLVLGTK